MFRKLILLAAFTLLTSSIVEANVAFTPKSSLRTINDDVSFTPKNSVASFPHKGITEIQGGATGGQSTMSKSIFNLVKGIVGVGVLSLPSGIAAFGNSKKSLVPAVALIILMGTLSGYNFSLIGRVCALTGASSYSDAWEKSIGSSSAWIPAVACTGKTFLACLAYSMVLGETFQGLLTAAGVQASRPQTLVGLTLTVILPLCLLKNLAALAPFSLLGIFGMALTVATMGLRCLDGSYGATGKYIQDVAKLPVFGSKVFSSNAIILACMLGTSFMAHFNAPKFYNELENNTVDRFNKLVSVSFGTSIAFFSLAAGFGFATFGESSAGFVLSNYSNKDTLVGIAKIAVAFSLIFTYPLVFVGCRDGTLSLLKVPKEKQTNATLNNITFVLLSLLTFAAINLKDLGFIMSFGGATLANALIYVFPAMMFNKIVKDKGAMAPAAMKKETYFTTFSMLAGLIMGAIGAKMSIDKL